MLLEIHKFFLIFLVFISVFLFSIIYNVLSKDPWIDCLYDSTVIQTLIGSQKRPKTRGEKIAVICQSILAYFLTAGVIVVTYHSIKRKFDF